MAESVELPFRTALDGRRYLTLEDLYDMPEAYDFVRRFGRLFEWDKYSRIVYFNEPPPQLDQQQQQAEAAASQPQGQ